MTTIEAIVQDLQQVPPEHLDKGHQLVQELKAEANRKLLADTLRLLQGTDELSTETWAEIDAYQRLLRTELFTRPNPFLANEADAA